jgi:catechol 2,3-dioxygenase-like lactoylglutathione lyase family enzyme
VTVRHLAIPVTDQQRSRAFYERYFGFGAQPAREYPDGVLMLYDDSGFALALGPADETPRPPDFLHFGFTTERAEDVRGIRETLELDGVEIVEAWDEPGYVSIKCRDPDGYVIEVFHEEAAGYR